MLRQQKSSRGKFKIFGEGPLRSTAIQTLNWSGIRAFRARQKKEGPLTGFKARDKESQRKLDEIVDISEYGSADNAEWFNIETILDGQAPINVSYAGGEFQELLEELRAWSKQREYCAHRDIIICRNLGFSAQLEAMVDAYLRWSETCGVSRQALAAPLSHTAVVQEMRAVKVVDLFGGETYSFDAPMLRGGETVAASLIEHSLIPSAPYHPNVAFATRAVELYRTTHLWCPRLKRIIRRELATEDKNGELTPEALKELKDNRDVDGDYYLSREVVDQ
ncbi:hypothetical protein C0992_007678 [Termitomyces sp. T32_za158]|nr:hypothetical protein C0992_007678 [Termitomyces sp. T32_za158]